MALPKFLQVFLPSYDISKMDLRNPYDKKLIIEAILNRGEMKDVKWLFKTYSKREIKNVLRDPSRGCWRERSLNYWTNVLDVKLPDIVYKVAILSLHPDVSLLKRYFNYLKKQGKISRETLEAWQFTNKVFKSQEA